jgi:glycosylphosphatidylinositol transamidase (GPIT) subunit GPI8
MFKIVDSYIYLVGNDLSQELKGEFSGTVYRNIDGVKTLIDDSIGGDLSIPENFSLNEFIKFAMEDDTNNAKLGYKLVK